MVDIKFLVPGFSKCGTTTLCSLLNQHPDIFIPKEKEPWYFSSPRYEEKHEEYEGLFASAKPGSVMGEGSTNYSGHKCEKISVERIHANHPECKFIFIARNPMKRIESSYREMHHSGVLFGLDAPYALGDALEVFPQMLCDSLYWDRIIRYRETFGDSSILVLFLEDLKANPQEQLKRCFQHIGVDDSFEITNKETKLNAGSSKLYDTRLLRAIRNNSFLGPKLAKINAKDQDKYLRPFMLRRPFKKPVQWDKKAIEALNTKILPNTKEFLNLYEKPVDFWRNLAE
jgi:hypothetical protein